ncbi:hypothetical protein MH117_06335 [Paenibacillus sp. ACRRX]|uniref:hypothetical protein n=1 Tax=Paenibacillus sp. ACRRX TaxID=2918206 RepID=UPI001EF5A52E|nr:hypothetical protein [Paenibacillus sp. ACRRX]MCG7407031.1 hypothetical protein [Paenibacillus sp. ACRRX]
MSTGLMGQLVVADLVVSNNTEKAHTIQHVRNKIAVRTYPAVAIIHVWVKIWILDEAEDVVYLNVLGPNDEMIWEKKFDDIVNVRSSEMPAGKDFSFEVRFVVHNEGIFKVAMNDQYGVELAKYPVYICCDDN